MRAKLSEAENGMPWRNSFIFDRQCSTIGSVRRLQELAWKNYTPLYMNVAHRRHEGLCLHRPNPLVGCLTSLT